ncbi:MAG TPA: tryptophan-rich sensory protein [Acetivibrio clariflavus]|nr:tryptophan-rich sensory protein [Acetivibrio clariflavus]
MEDSNVSTFTKVHTTVTFVVMIVVNILANIIPFNDMTTGQVSKLYPNLFSPAPITFSIWVVIYLLLAGYILYQFGFLCDRNGIVSKELIEKISVFFSVSSMANTCWIFLWHFNSIGISLALMTVILVCLIFININTGKVEFTLREKLLIRLPFSIYFGWITIAAIANATIFLVSIGWNRFGIPDWLWTVIILVAGVVIAGLTMLKNQNLGYGIAVIWGYVGILIKHTSKNGFGGKYPFIILTLILCIIVLLIAEVYFAVTDKEKLKDFKLFKRKTQ